MPPLCRRPPLRVFNLNTFQPGNIAWGMVLGMGIVLGSIIIALSSPLNSMAYRFQRLPRVHKRIVACFLFQRGRRVFGPSE